MPEPLVAKQTNPLQAQAVTPTNTSGATAATQGKPAPQKPIFPTPDDVIKVLPDASKKNIIQYLPYVLKAMCEYNMLSKNQLIAFIATIGTETASFAPIPEMNPSLSNPEGGVKYKGRGFIQITHLSNYRAASKKFGVDLVANPDLALQPELAAKIGCWFWSGGTGSPDIRPYAEKGDWNNCRSLVNAGSPGKYGVCWGRADYEKWIANGIRVFQQGLDPAAIGVMPLSGAYGKGCIDPGSGGSRTISSTNPQSQGDALATALGLHLLDRQKTHILKARMNCANFTDLLKLDVQKTFKATSFGTDLDGDYTVEELIIYPLSPGLEVFVHAYKPDPNAPDPQIFLHDTNSGLGPNQIPTPGGATSVPTDQIRRKIYEAAKAYYGTNTSAGPGNGNTACAWSVNNILQAAIGHKIGAATDDSWSVRDALNAGYGKKLPVSEAQSGDIAFFGNYCHIGIVVDGGIWSNSSSTATWTWKAGMDFGGNGANIFQVLK